MKRLFKWAFVFCLIAAPAWGAWNIQQGDQGETRWIDQEGTATGVGGGSHLQITVDMSSAVTRYILTHRGGVIRRAYLMLNTAFSGEADPSLTLWRIGYPTGALESTSGYAPGQAAQISHPGGFTLTLGTGTAGDVFHHTTAPTVNNILIGATANVIGIVPGAALTCSNDTNVSCSVNVIIVIE